MQERGMLHDSTKSLLTAELLQNYRSYIIFRIPSVRFLDFQKVRDVERVRAKELFGTIDAPSALASKISGIKSRGVGTFDTSTDSTSATTSSKAFRVQLTDKEKKRFEKLIRNAKSLQEIAKLEKDLNEGRIPPGIGADSDDEE